MKQGLETRTGIKIDLDKLLKRLNEIPGEEWVEEYDECTHFGYYVYRTSFVKIKIDVQNDRFFIYNSLGDSIYQGHGYTNLVKKINSEREKHKRKTQESDINKLNEWIKNKQ